MHLICRLTHFFQIDVVPHLRKLSTTLDSLWLCNSLDHYAASHGDAGWGCGYRYHVDLYMFLVQISLKFTSILVIEIFKCYSVPS